MIYAVRNCVSGAVMYIKAKSGYEALDLFVKGLKKRSTIMAHENFYFVIIDSVVYSTKRG